MVTTQCYQCRFLYRPDEENYAEVKNNECVQKKEFEIGACEHGCSVLKIKVVSRIIGERVCLFYIIMFIYTQRNVVI